MRTCIDLVVEETLHKSQMSTVLMIDISHSMILYGEDRITPAKKVAMALAELITTRYPKDTLDIIVFGNDAWSIKIKDLPDTTFTVKISNHGPIMNSLVKEIHDKRPMAMQWMYTKLENQILDVGYQISHATSLEEFKNGASLLHAPGLNMMYGDAQNNIAWFASGKLYKYRDSLNTKLVLDGASGKDEVLEYLDFEDNPQAINPDWNYVYSSNNQPDSIAGILYPGYYLPEDLSLIHI